jgi:hypothetical protein
MPLGDIPQFLADSGGKISDLFGSQQFVSATPEFAKSRDERKKVEMHFAHLKTHRRFERMRLRGLSGARDEFHLAAIVQNLKTLANHIWRPPDATLACAT